MSNELDVQNEWEKHTHTHTHTHTHYVLHIAMRVLLIDYIDYRSKYKSYAFEPSLPVHKCLVVLDTSITVSTLGQFVPNLGCHLVGVGLNVP